MTDNLLTPWTPGDPGAVELCGWMSLVTDYESLWFAWAGLGNCGAHSKCRGLWTGGTKASALGDGEGRRQKWGKSTALSKSVALKSLPCLSLLSGCQPYSRVEGPPQATETYQHFLSTVEGWSSSLFLLLLFWMSTSAFPCPSMFFLFWGFYVSLNYATWIFVLFINKVKITKKISVF